MSKQRNITNLPLDGGLLCLDFINTVQTRMKPVFHEYLTDYYIFLEWCLKVDILTHEEVLAFEATGVRMPTRVSETFREIIASREMLYKLFSSNAAGQAVAKGVLDQFNRLLAEALSHIGFVNKDNSLHQNWVYGPDDLVAPLWKIIKSAYDTLTAPEIKYVKECSACGWLFIDRSKTHTRRWCNPLECGSVDKATRYYHRMKAKAANDQKNNPA